MNSETKVTIWVLLLTFIVVVIGLMLAPTKAEAPKLSLDKEHLISSTSPRFIGKDAKIQIVEFADFECPACAMLHPELSKLLKEYKDIVDFSYRTVPIHEGSVDAAMVALAAHKQGKFTEMHDILFENQREWSGISVKNRAPKFKEYASKIGLDIVQFEKDIKDVDLAKTIDKDADDADVIKVSATPTLIIGTQAVQGVQSYETLKKVLEAELAKPSIDVGGTKVQAEPVKK